jgi:tetratricopeptide (TPR) repeat protein
MIAGPGIFVEDTGVRPARAIHLVRVISLSTFALLYAGSASAQDRRAHARALALFDQSELAYQERRYEAAAQLLEEAYSIEPEPLLLYNLGRAYEALEDVDRARSAYERYLATDIDEEARAEVRARIAALAAPVAPPIAEPAPIVEPAPAGPELGGPIATLAGAGAVWLAAIGLAIGAEVQNGAAFDLSLPYAEARSAADVRDALAIAANISFVLGGALAAGGGVWLGVALGSGPPSARGALPGRAWW